MNALVLASLLAIAVPAPVKAETWICDFDPATKRISCKKEPIHGPI